MSLKISSEMETLQRNSKKLYQSYSGKIVDIVLFGSFAREKLMPRDIDIAVILKNTREDDLPQLMEKFSNYYGRKVHLNLVMIETLFSNTLFKPLIEEGISLLDNAILYRKLGYESGAVFSFTLTNLTKSKKVLFSYALHGKKNQEGLLKKVDGREIGRAVVFVPIQYIDNFKQFLSLWDVDFYMMKILRG